MTEQEIVEYSLTKKGAYADFPFGPEPLCVKIAGRVAVQVYTGKITLKCEPSIGLPYREQYAGTVMRGYHCPAPQQPYFNTVCLNGGVPDAKLRQMIDEAFEAVVKKLPASLKKQLRAERDSEDIGGGSQGL